jgi:hypothetical protein
MWAMMQKFRICALSVILFKHIPKEGYSQEAVETPILSQVWQKDDAFCPAQSSRIGVSTLG